MKPVTLWIAVAAIYWILEVIGLNRRNVLSLSSVVYMVFVPIAALAAGLATWYLAKIRSRVPGSEAVTRNAVSPAMATNLAAVLVPGIINAAGAGFVAWYLTCLLIDALNAKKAMLQAEVMDLRSSSPRTIGNCAEYATLRFENNVSSEVCIRRRIGNANLWTGSRNAAVGDAVVVSIRISPLGIVADQVSLR